MRLGRSALAGVLARLDPIVLVIALVAVLGGTIVGATGTGRDVDEVLFRSTIHRMQDGDPYYSAFVDAVVEDKQGIAPSAVRSVRTPVVPYLLVAFPPAAWRWLAALPALALCLLASVLAGPELLARRLAAALCGVWMIVSLPYLYLHAELWGAPLVVGAGLLARRGRDGLAATATLAATSMRELYVVWIVVGLLWRRRRAPWLGALAVAGAGALLHASWARPVLDPDGFDPPLRAVDSYLAYVSPGATGPAQVVGALLLVAAVAGCWLRRRDAGVRFLAAGAAPLVVGAALSGRSYWTLTWCGITSALGAVVLVELAERLGWHQPDRGRDTAPYPAV